MTNISDIDKIIGDIFIFLPRFSENVGDFLEKVARNLEQLGKKQ